MNRSLWTALVTPFLEDSSVDLKSLTTLLKEQEEADNGIVLLGSTGEGLNLNLSDKKIILETAKSLNLKVPIMVAIEGLKIDDCLSFITYVESLNFDAYLAVTPLYAKPGVFGQYRWFKTILDAVTKPVMLYNIPSRSGTSLSLKALELLVGHKNLWAVKEASGSNDAFGEYAKIISSYSGDDGKLNDFISLGAKGLVSVASNCWPKETNLYVKLSMENKVSTADLLLWKEACDALFIASNPIPVKSLLYILGRIKTAKFRLPLAAEDLPSVRLLEEADSKIRSWFK